ncbi:hypothetical protein EXIGLDRAFT_726905 [Exidia glandulosa HHB12029]|uniref:Uncharacterized protein n=1 Tax=Exidia glandulosa HHB12029 TaxID=1314781 RepID=A0A165ZPL9_EXIGL|nr:hypothetical protein EXIGLDRAFT_726905 [Exidia glandulosa HHB12029]
MDVPLTATPMERKWDTFLMAQRRRNDLFIRRHSERKAQLQEREADRGQIFERSLTLWQLAATAAERQRTVEFAQALAHAESLWVSSSARRASVGAQVALRLSATFAEAQQAREDAFHLELAGLNGDLMEELKSFVEVLEAFGKRLELRPRAPSQN